MIYFALGFTICLCIVLAVVLALQSRKQGDATTVPTPVSLSTSAPPSPNDVAFQYWTPPAVVEREMIAAQLIRDFQLEHFDEFEAQREDEATG